VLTAIWRRIRPLWRRRTTEAELDEELQFHFERQVEKYVRAGLPRGEAVRQARLVFGGAEQVKEECRQVWGLALLEGVLQDLRYAVRGLRRSRGFTVVVVLSLALGIGANTAMFSLMNAIMWRMLPVAEPQRLVLLARTRGAAPSPGFTYQEFGHLREGSGLATLAAYAPLRINASIDGRAEPTLRGQLISGSYVAVLGADPMIALRSE
jgi:hypothetical protein